MNATLNYLPVFWLACVHYSEWFKFLRNFTVLRKRIKIKVLEMVQWLRILAALPETLSQVLEPVWQVI